MHQKEEREATLHYSKKTDKKKLLVIIPHKNHVPKGTLLSILEQADLSKEELLKLK